MRQKMSKDPAVLFYTSDFLTGTSRLTDEQVGQYIRALCSQHQEGMFSKEELFQILKSYDSPVWKKFIQNSEGLFYNERMKKEIENRVSYCNSKSHPGISGRPKKSYDNHMDNHMVIISKSSANHTEDEDDNDTEYLNKNISEVPVHKKRLEPKFVPPSFEEFEKFCIEKRHKNIARQIYD